MFAFLRLGFRDEAAAYLELARTSAATCDRERRRRCRSCTASTARSDLTEHELGAPRGLPRLGPGAHRQRRLDQLQLDVYGEVIDAVYLAERNGMPLSYALWVKLRTILDWLADNWDQPDEGIWEVRGGRRDFTYSRIMRWVAFDRALRIQAKRGLPARHAASGARRAMPPTSGS